MSSTIQSSGLTGFAVPNGQLACSISGGYLTVSIKNGVGADSSPAAPLYSAFPLSGLATGKPITGPVTLTTNNYTFAFGLINDLTPFRVWALLFDNQDGTFTLGIRSCSALSSIYPLAESGLGSAVAFGAGNNLAGVTYAPTAVANKPFRIVGFMEWSSGLASNGFFDALPDIIQLYGPGCKKPGDVVQKATSSFSTRSTGTTNIPLDDTIPQKTEGDLYFTNTIAPTSKVNVLEHILSMAATVSVDNTQMVACLFQDSAADAIYVSPQFVPKANVLMQLGMLYFMQAGTISSTDFKIRAGKSAAVVVTFGVNGSTSCQFFGSKSQSSFATTEYMG